MAKQKLNIKDAIPLPHAAVMRVTEQITNSFMTETPPADYVEVVAGSIKPVDIKFGLWKGMVRTDVYVKHTLKQHVSNIRFKLDAYNNLVPTSITFS